MDGVDGVDHRPARGREILQVAASFSNGPPLGQLPDVRWSLSARPENTTGLGWRLGSIRQEASWGVGGGVWEVPFNLGFRGWPARPRLTGWKAIWSGGGGGLWVQRWTLRPKGGGAQGDGTQGDSQSEGGSQQLALAVESPLQILGHEVEVARCHGEVLAGRVLAEVLLRGEVYASGRGGAVRRLPLLAEASLLLQIPEARVGDTWRADAEVAPAVWRPAQDGSVGMAAVVHLRWRLLREEVVRWPLEASAPALFPPGRYLLARIAAEGEDTLPVQARVGLHPEQPGMSNVGTHSAISLPGEVQRIRMEPLALGALFSGGDFRLGLRLSAEGQPILGARSAKAGWRWTRPAKLESPHQSGDNRKQASLLALEWEGDVPDPSGEAVCTITLARTVVP